MYICMYECMYIYMHVRRLNSFRRNDWTASDLTMLNFDCLVALATVVLLFLLLFIWAFAVGEPRLSIIMVMVYKYYLIRRYIVRD